MLTLSLWLSFSWQKVWKEEEVDAFIRRHWSCWWIQIPQSGETSAEGRPTRRHAINAAEEEDGKAERGCESRGGYWLR